MNTIATVVYSSDFNSLKLQALSFEKFLKVSKNELEILIILNDDENHLKYLEEIIIPYYGKYSSCCRILTRKDLNCTNAFVHGWLQQQVYKLLISKFINEKSYLVLDSKNHLIRDFNIENFLSAPLKWFRVNRNGHLSAGFEESYRYFGLNPSDFIDLSAANVTPFVFYTEAVLNMISEIELKESRLFYDFFVSSKVLEFDLYSAYVTANPIWSYEDCPRNFITLFKDKIVDENNFASMMYTADNPEIKFFALHHDSINYINNSQKEIIKKFWINLGLFDNIESTNEFL